MDTRGQLETAFKAVLDGLAKCNSGEGSARDNSARKTIEWADEAQALLDDVKEQLKPMAEAESRAWREYWESLGA